MKEYKLVNLPKTNAPVSLMQYTLIEDENNTRFLILKLKNNENTELSAVEMEINEIDSSGIPIRKRLYFLKDIIVEAGKYYIPSSKFAVTKETDTIEYKITKASFVNRTWEQEEWLDDAPDDSEVQEVIKETKVNKINIKPNLLQIITPIALSVVLIFLLATSFNSYYKEFNPEGKIFNYTELGDNKIKIDRYLGRSRDVIIPEYLDGKLIAEIGSNAFFNTNITSVHFEGGNIKIQSFCFANTDYLRSVTGSSLLEVDAYSFHYATRLKTFRFDDVVEIKASAFEGTRKLKVLEIKNIENTYFSYGALQGSGLNNLYTDDKIEVLDQMLISVASGVRNLELGSHLKIKTISKNAFKKGGSRINSLIINVEQIYLDKELFRYLSALSRVELNSSVRVEDDLFYFISGYIDYLEMPEIGDSFSDLFSSETVSIGTLVINSAETISSGYIDDRIFISVININFRNDS